MPEHPGQEYLDAAFGPREAERKIADAEVQERKARERKEARETRP